MKKTLNIINFILVLVAIAALVAIRMSQDTAQYSAISQLQDRLDALQSQVQNEQLGADSTLTIGGTVYYLSGSGISSSATTIGLTSLTLPQTGYKIQDSDLSDTFYITIEPGSQTRQEFVSCTTVTQNGDGTATLTGCSRGLLPISPYTASSTYAFAHSGGKTVVFSNSPQLYNDAAFKNNDETVTGTWTYTSTAQPRYDTTPTLTGNDLYFASVGYADAIANQGAATSSESNSGISELATQLEMASSTDLGANKPLVLQAKYATSSPSASGHWAVITNASSKIAQAFLDLTEDFTWSGSHIFSGIVTFNGTTTLPTTTLFGTNTVESILPKSFVAGTDITAGDAIALSDGTSVSTTTSQSVDTTPLGDRYQAQTFKVDNGYSLTSILIDSLHDVDSETRTAAIRRTSGGLPTGSDIASTTYTVGNTGGTVSRTLTFTGGVEVTPGETLALVIYTTGTLSTDAYPRYKASGTYGAGGVATSSDGITWTTVSSHDWDLNTITTYYPTAGTVIPTNTLTDSIPAQNFIGFAESTVSSGATVSVDGVGFTDAVSTSTLSVGEKYYLSNSIGQISTSAGNYSYPVGIAVSSSTILIKHDN